MSDDVRVWVNGSRVDEGPAIAALDHGVTVGDGVFETAKIVDNEVFALRRHHDRIDRSLAGLGLPPVDRDRVAEGIEAVLADGPIAFGRLRYTVTAGPGPLGSDRLDGPLTYIVTAGEQPPFPASTSIAVVPWTRNERAATVGLKTTSYAENVVALKAAKELGGSEAIFANTRGQLCEGTGSNIFVVTGDVIRTPALSSGPLAGITRELAVEWCQEAGMQVIEDELSLDVLNTCDEIFLTSSTRDIQAVHALEVVEGKDTMAGRVEAPEVRRRDFAPAPGPLTTQAAKVFAEYGTARFNP